MQTYMNGKVKVYVGDITKEEVDVIVSAANSSLLGGGGVDGAIHRAGGEEILIECRRIRRDIYPNGMPTGCAVKTGAGNLKAKHIIHTVGPIWDIVKGDTDAVLSNQLRDCYLHSLLLVDNNSCKSIAFPAISTGIFSFPKPLAAKIASLTVRLFLHDLPRAEHIEEVRFVFFSAEDMQIFIENQQFDSPLAKAADFGKLFGLPAQKLEDIK